MPASLARGLAALLMGWAVSLSSARPQEAPPLPPPRPSPSPSQTLYDRPPLPAAASTPPSSPIPAAGAGACLAELKANRVEAEAVPAPPASLPDCRIATPVRLSAIGLANGATLDLPARPILDCAFAATFAGFVRDLLAPLGAANLGAPVVALDTGPGYECRGRNRVPGAKTSAHGQGIAIDIVAVALADRRRVAIASQADAREISFVRAMRRAACGWFTTVLGPGADAAHANHLHFDALRHGASDNYRICE